MAEPRCAVCGRTLIVEHAVCAACRQRDHACDRTVALFEYRGAAAGLLRAYKMDKRTSLTGLFAGLIADAVNGLWPGRVLVPVPPRPEKARRHEWDQVESIAGQLARMGFPVARPLVRLSAAQQKTLSKAGRLENASKAYAVAASCGSVPKSAVLLDDIYTTGATIDACAAALKAGGSVEVSAIVIAAD